MGTQPKRIGRYEILSPIGRGATGIVYKARDPLIDRIVAVKRVSLGEMLPEKERLAFHERFLREARAAGGLKHPNIVVIHDVGEDGGLPYMAMEYLEGGSLASLMRSRGALPIDDALAIVRQVAGGLAYAHTRGIVHRDIKPDNILLDREGRAVITDFGAARLQNSELTRTGEVLGTPYYMSPEQVLGNPLDGRSDLFSLGVILYLLVTGRRPFKGDTITTICYHIVHSEPEPIPQDLRLPAPLLALLDKMLAKNRDGRFASGEEMRSAIDDLTGSPPTISRASGLTQTLGVPTPVPSVQAPSAHLPPADLHPSAAPAPVAFPPSASSHPTAFPPSSPSGGGPATGERSQKLLIGGLALGSLLAVILLLVVVALVVAYFVWLRPRPAEPIAPPAAPQAQQAAPPAKTEAQQAGVSAPSAPTPTPPAAVQPAHAKEPPPAPPQIQRPPAQPSYVQTGGLATVPVQSASVKTPPVEAPASAPGPNPAFVSGAEGLAQDAANAASLAHEAHFGQAFRALDEIQEKMRGFALSAGPQDQAVLEKTRTRVEQSQAEALKDLADWARSLLARAQGTYSEATDHINTDEDGVEKAYAQLFPVLKWKERLPPDLKQAATTLVQNCRENLNDEEWATAEALARGEKSP